MKRFLTEMLSSRFLVIAIVLVLSTLAAHAQKECDAEAVNALYKKFLTQYRGSLAQQKTANDIAKQYLEKFGDCTGEEEVKIATYIKDWQLSYAALVDEVNCTTAVEKTPAQAFTICRPHLARDPENLRTHLLLSLAGIRNSRTTDATLKAETVRSARKALALIKGGDSVENWIFGSKDTAVDTLEFYAAYFTMDSEPADAAQAMLRLAHSSSSYNKDPNTYFYLARSLQNGEVKKQVAEYNSKCGAALATPDCEKFNDKIEATIDRVIDAYARAIALSAGNPEHAAVATAVRPLLAELYKKRHQDSEAGLDKLIAEVLSKPMP